MRRILRTLTFSGFLYLTVFPIQSHAAKLVSAGDDTVFSGSVTASISINGPRYDVTGDPVENFSESGSDSESPSGHEVNSSVLVQVLDDVTNSQTEGEKVIDVSAYISATKNIEATWYDTGSGGGDDLPAQATPEWINDYANAVSVGGSCNASVTPRRPSYYKYGGDESDSNNDKINNINASASFELQGDGAEFTIEPVLLEQTGDNIEVTVRNGTPRISIFNDDESSEFSSTTNSSGSIIINGSPVDVPEGETVTVTARIGDTITLSSSAGLTTAKTGDYTIPGKYSTITDYRLHSISISKGVGSGGGCSSRNVAE